MSTNKAPAFQLFANDLLSDTLTWTAQELGVHIRLMCWSWVNGPLPSDLDRIARIDPCAPAVWSVVGPKWTKGDTGYTNDRLERSRSEQEAYRAKQSERGQASARARAERNAGSTSVGTTVGTLVEPNNQPSLERAFNPRVVEPQREGEDEGEGGRKKAEDIGVRVLEFERAVHDANAKRTGAGPNGPMPPAEVAAFVAYWTQHGPNDRKTMAEKQRVFDIPKRLVLWASKVNWSRYGHGTTTTRLQATVMDRNAPIEGRVEWAPKTSTR